MIDQFLNLLIEAIANVPALYFQLPVAGQEDPIYRERVYCYELYHQLRPLLARDRDLNRYTLSGEIDKAGHRIIRHHVPDFVLHIPGHMDNLAIIEVKPINGDREGILKDLRTLRYFVSDEVGYKLGIHLVYGDDGSAFERFERQFRVQPNEKLQLFWHRQFGERATRIR